MREAQLEKIKGILSRVEPVGRVLDIGCGAGFLEGFIHGIVAVDVDRVNLRKSDGSKVVADGNRLPFRDAVFDTVFCIDVIHLLQKAGELARVLRQEGILVLTLFCNEYNQDARMKELRERAVGMRIIDEFYAGSRELDAVLVCSKK